MVTLAGGGRNPQDHPTSKWGWQRAAPQSRRHSNSGSLGQEGLEGLGLFCFPLIQPTQQGLEKTLPTLCGHGHVVKVMVVWFIPSLKVPLGNMCQPIPTCRGSSTLRFGGPTWYLLGIRTMNGGPLEWDYLAPSKYLTPPLSGESLTYRASQARE